jgi:phage baseplate assembly protein W
MTMRTFKSVGITGVDFTTQQTAVTPAPLPIGIITPIQLGANNEGLLAMSYSVAAQMKNNLRDLVMTNWGERVALYDYGANLGPLVTEYEMGRDAFNDAAMQRISIAVSKYMPYVTLEGFDSTSERTFTTDPGLGIIVILLDYSIPKASVPTTRLRITFAVS